MYKKFEKLLIDNNVTAYKVAQDTGITKSTFSDWKSGRSEPKLAKLIKIADYFGVPLEYFVRGSDDETGSE